ncbi:NADH-quinone oxidoreductase subunit C [Methanonatronarchaeum sp. AMET-Sl]|uniref:NADH-quinone oxidoreductase subunit C n=1 Tax=Methanonatronarchaeum sp. AMET-Sl TaxID=3037654 RepID=UPI00244DFE5E|nr:NADH-quinone oxidoreductase subunit C [Methanonatronarchaeum sp. AMET-Sl]WGI16709.1 NADH-quinone oxidoreductase subunit C [Methanonatronarchaeum sp. AMET-Sl]
MDTMDAEELYDHLYTEYGDEIKGLINKERAGVSKKESQELWVRTPRNKLKNLINHLKQIQLPHFVTMMGVDRGDNILTKYILSMFYGEKFREITLVLCVEIPKDDLWLPTISDIIPGSLTSEREIQEMLGIEIKDIPDERHFFLPWDHPEEEYPWRRDEKRIEVQDVYEKEGQQ